MKVTNETLQKIASFEGFRDTSYRCQANILTIGYGHTGKDVKENQKITMEQGLQLLTKDIEKCEKAVLKLQTEHAYFFNQNQFDALVSFCFNLGTGIFKQLTDNYKRSMSEIGNAILMYDKANVNGKKTVLAGLTRRRRWEKELYFTTTVDTEREPYNSYFNGTLKAQHKESLSSKVKVLTMKCTTAFCFDCGVSVDQYIQKGERVSYYGYYNVQNDKKYLLVSYAGKAGYILNNGYM